MSNGKDISHCVRWAAYGFNILYHRPQFLLTAGSFDSVTLSLEPKIHHIYVGWTRLLRVPHFMLRSDRSYLSSSYYLGWRDRGNYLSKHSDPIFYIPPHQQGVPVASEWYGANVVQYFPKRTTWVRPTLLHEVSIVWLAQLMQTSCANSPTPFSNAKQKSRSVSDNNTYFLLRVVIIL